MKRIGIVGYYDFGNFGDDLMALGIARVLQAQATHPVIFSSNRALERHGVEIENDLDRLMSTCDAVIQGGGGSLLNHTSSDPATKANHFSRQLLLIARAAARRGLPLYAVSIGGDSHDIIRPLRPGIVAYLTAPSFRAATVRLKADADCLEYLGARAAYFPDIVLSLRSMFPEFRDLRPTGRKRIGVQCKPGVMAQTLSRLAAAGRIPEIVFIHTSQRDFDALAPAYAVRPNVEHYLARDVFETVKFVADLSAVVGSRLHISLVAAVLGIPVYAVDPQRKVERFFEDIGLAVPALPEGWLARRSIPRTLAQPQAVAPEISAARQASEGHLNFIRDCICR